MQKICDVCGSRGATRIDCVKVNGKSVEYAYCDACYMGILKSGRKPREAAMERISRIGKECRICGHTIEMFEESLLLGCPDCYRQMSAEVNKFLLRTQGGPPAALPSVFKRGDVRAVGKRDGYKSADECTVEELVRGSVVSSRVRLARNAEGMNFPRSMSRADSRTADMIKCCLLAADGIFDAHLLTMSELTKAEKKALIERRLISLLLTNNDMNGAAVIEKGRFSEMSVMINEEDHLREQCVVRGHALSRAYARLHSYDLRLQRQLPFAYDGRFGYLTACPTNAGTGMRASEMLFLPALERADAIDSALETFKNAYGLTVRGYFGEGSGAAYGMYQISNSRTFGVSEADTVALVERAAERMCYLERVALDRLVREHRTQLIKGIRESYGRLVYAYSLTMPELMEKLADVRLGVILGELPIKNVSAVNEIIDRCALFPEVIAGNATQDDINKARANIVRRILAEEKQ